MHCNFCCEQCIILITNLISCRLATSCCCMLMSVLTSCLLIVWSCVTTWFILLWSAVTKVYKVLICKVSSPTLLWRFLKKQTKIVYHSMSRFGVGRFSCWYAIGKSFCWGRHWLLVFFLSFFPYPIIWWIAFWPSYTRRTSRSYAFSYYRDKKQ